MNEDRTDPRGLIREAYEIEGIEAAECRSIFLDWALFDATPEGQAMQLSQLLERHGAAHPDHPMTAILKEAVAAQAQPGRRRGRARRASRRRD